MRLFTALYDTWHVVLYICTYVYKRIRGIRERAAHHMCTARLQQYRYIYVLFAHSMIPSSHSAHRYIPGTRYIRTDATHTTCMRVCVPIPYMQYGPANKNHPRAAVPGILLHTAAVSRSLNKPYVRSRTLIIGAYDTCLVQITTTPSLNILERTLAGFSVAFAVEHVVLVQVSLLRACYSVSPQK